MTTATPTTRPAGSDRLLSEREAVNRLAAWTVPGRPDPALYEALVHYRRYYAITHNDLHCIIEGGQHPPMAFRGARLWARGFTSDGRPFAIRETARHYFSGIVGDLSCENVHIPMRGEHDDTIDIVIANAVDRFVRLVERARREARERLAKGRGGLRVS